MKRLKLVNPNTSMIDPRGTVEDFEFAFDDGDLSDPILHIEIIKDSLDSMFDGVHTHGFYKKSTNEDLEHKNDGSEIVKVTDLHISAPIVAAKSPFFYKLFKNGMSESLQRDLTLRVTTSEEAAFQDVLKFMYNNTLSATTVPDLVDVLVVADKYEVVSCMRYCIEVLQAMPMSLESALLYLELPSCVVDSEVVQSLLHATKQYLAARYRNISKSKEEVMSLPLTAMEVVLGSDGLEVHSEDVVFDLVLNWARIHYPELEERRDVLSNRLSRLVCFRNLGSTKLNQILLNCAEFDHEKLSKLVFDALYFKAEGRTIYTTGDTLIAYYQRVYTYHPIKVVKLGLSQPSCIVYFELKKQDCADLFESRNIYSDTICLGGQSFFLLPRCFKDPQSALAHFVLYVFAHKGSRSFRCDYEVEVMKKPLKVFEISQQNFKAPKCDPSAVVTVVGFNVFGIEWKDFMADESQYFIDGILHLRITMTISNFYT